MYNININGKDLTDYPCYYLHHILDIYIVSGKKRYRESFGINYVTSTPDTNPIIVPSNDYTLFQITAGNNPNKKYHDFLKVPLLENTPNNRFISTLSCVKFRGSEYSTTTSEIFSHGVAGPPVEPNGCSITPSAFLNAKVYVFYPVTKDIIDGYGVSVFNKNGEAIYVKSSGSELYYAENMQVGSASGNRLYLSTLYKQTRGGYGYYYATSSTGSIVTMKMRNNYNDDGSSWGSVTPNISNISPIISIDPVPSSVENKLKTTERYIYVR